MTSFFHLVNKRAICRLGIISFAHASVHVTDCPVVNVHVDELSSARIIIHNIRGQLPMQSVPTTTDVVNSNLAHGEVYSIQHYVIMFVGYLSPGTPVSTPIEIDPHGIAEILLKVALSRITLILTAM